MYPLTRNTRAHTDGCDEASCSVLKHVYRIRGISRNLTWGGRGASTKEGDSKKYITKGEKENYCLKFSGQFSN